jgi:phage protein U
MANWVLYQWGPIQFQVFPFNVNTFSHNTATDWAKKEIAGAAMYREWVGENDELITLKGLIFPHYFARAERNRNIKHPVLSATGGINPATGLLGEHKGGFPSAGGLYHLDVLDNMRRLGQAHILIRGDGWHYGWFVIDTLSRGHSNLAHDGIGQKIEFEAQFQRVPIPNDGASNIIQMYGSGSVQESGPPEPPPPVPSLGARQDALRLQQLREQIIVDRLATDAANREAKRLEERERVEEADRLAAPVAPGWGPVIRNVGPDGQPLDISDDEARRRLREAGVGA